jgi:hypothetical protein
MWCCGVVLVVLGEIMAFACGSGIAKAILF